MAHGGDIEGGLAPPPEAIAAATPPVEAHAPRVLTFDDVSYTVKTGSGSKVVLAPVSGSCVGGRLFVLMGPSGAGKTSLLDILAGAPVAGKPAGHVLLNGKPMARGRSGDGQRALSCYVQQRDVLLPSATVREALTTAAMLQLPLSLPIALKRERVNQLLAQLDLLRCADTLIGDESFGIKGISGGEKRRTSVGIELVKDPAVVFLDEPTSGLDSEMALGVMRAIKALARQGKVCVATIHQPASDITDLFDDFMLLSLGRVVYQGPWLDAVPYFSKHGYACPTFKNPADVFITLVHDASVVEHLARACAEEQQQQGRRPALPAPEGLGSGGSAAGTLAGASPAGSLAEGSGRSVAALEVAPARGAGGHAGRGNGGLKLLVFQVWVLSVRFLRSWWRTPIMLITEAMSYILLGVFVGLLYLNLGNNFTLPAAAADRFACVFLSLTMVAFIPSYTSMVTWDYEKVLMRREKASGAYSTGAFFLAKTLTVAPFQVVQVLAFCVAVYFMAGLGGTASQFLIFYAVTLMFTLTSETLGLISAFVSPNSKVAVSVLTVILVIALSFSGFLVQVIPVYFVWIPKISYFTYSSAALTQNEFTGLVFYDPATGTDVGASTVIPSAMDTGLNMQANILVVLAMTIGTRIIAWLMLEVSMRQKRRGA